MSKPIGLDDDDIALFRDSVGVVVPLAQDRIQPYTARPNPDPIQSKADERRVLEEMANATADPDLLETGDELLFCRPGIQNRLLRKLRRGQFLIESELDLHGMTVVMAKQALTDFLARSLSKNHRCVRVIHGKGLGSKDGIPVLKNRLNHWLRQRNEILAYCPARPMDGGTGAIYLLIQKRVTG